MNNIESMGKRIKAERNRKKWTQAGLGMAVHIDSSTVSLWENDKKSPSVEQAVLLSEIFGVSIDYLVNGVKPETEKGDIISLEDLPYSVRNHIKGIASALMAKSE